MSLNVTGACTRQGKPDRVNEDFYGYAGNTAWVIDGATGMGEGNFIADPDDSDAAWLARNLGGFLAENALAYGADLTTLLKAARSSLSLHFNAAVRAMPTSDYDWPSAAVTLLHANDEGVYVASLGDTVALLRDQDGQLYSWYGDATLRAMDARVQAEIRERQLKNKDVPLKQHREAVAPHLRRNRTFANAPTGYGVFALRNDFTPHIKADFRAGVTDGDGLLMSDGYHRLVENFKRYSDMQLLEAVRTSGLESVCDELRRLEEDDPEGHSAPRTKKSDDATALHLRIG